MLDLRSGLPYHWIRNGLPYDYPKLQQDLRCDVLVVGGGITGALCAHALVCEGASVIVVDARTIAAGSTCASTALLQYEIDTPMHVLAERIGLRDAARAYHLCAEAIDQLVSLAERLGAGRVVRRKSLQFASSRKDDEALAKEYALRTAQGFHVELLSAREVRSLFGFKRSSALLSHLGAEMDPYAFTHALLQDVLRRGGKVFDRTEVELHTPRNEVHQAKTEDGHRIEALHVVMATGYTSQQHLPSPVMDLQSTYAVASERLPGGDLWFENCLIWETAMPYLYLRTTPDGRMIIGGLDIDDHSPKHRDALLARKTRRLTKAARKLFPHIDFRPEYAWCGTFGSTKDGLPYIDRSPETGAWFVLGMGGNGIVFSQVGANIMRDVIRGRMNADARLFAFDR